MRNPVEQWRRDTEIIRECLRAVVEGPFVIDSDFQTLIGCDRMQAAAVLARWPSSEEEQTQDLVVNNGLLHLVAGPMPRSAVDQWDHWISVPPEEVARLLAYWRGDDEPIQPSAHDDFD